MQAARRARLLQRDLGARGLARALAEHGFLACLGGHCALPEGDTEAAKKALPLATSVRG
jgi:hypothetical protein